jgi:hypothetical protein
LLGRKRHHAQSRHCAQQYGYNAFVFVVVKHKIIFLQKYDIKILRSVDYSIVLPFILPRNYKLFVRRLLCFQPPIPILIL